MRALVNDAANAANQANSTGIQYGTQQSAVNAQLFPFLVRELNSPTGFTQQQKDAMLTGAEAGAGGSTAGLTTEAKLAEARNRNSAGFGTALDEAARQRDKALASTGEGIEAENAQVQNQQQQSAARGLGNMQELDANSQLKAMGLIPEDVNAGTNAQTQGWLQSWNQFNKDLGGTLSLGATAGIPGLQGFKPQGGGGGQG